jgi:hypothetical protein
MEDTQSSIYDINKDPMQETRIYDKKIKNRLDDELLKLVTKNDAPTEAIARIRNGLEKPLT